MSNSELTFRINRSDFLKEILKSRGWTECSKYSYSNFSMWFSDSTTTEDHKEPSFISLYDRKYTEPMNNKREYYLHISKLENNDFTPLTFTTYESALEYVNKDSSLQVNKIWYLKYALGTEGNFMWCYLSFDELIPYATKSGVMDTYIIQKEIPNPLLILNRKFDFRVFCLVINHRLYVYTKVLTKLHPDPYDKLSRDRGVHYESSNADKMITFDAVEELENFDSTFVKIKDIMKKVINHFFKEIPSSSNSESMVRWGIYGIDFIVDTDEKPWLLEINTYPSLFDTGKYSIEYKKQLLNDMCDFFICPSAEEKTTTIKEGEFNFEKLH